MSAEIDELLEVEYTAQQEGASHIQPIEVEAENEKKLEQEVSVLLVDISETLRLLHEQMIRLDKITKFLPDTISVLKITTEAVQGIANDLPAMVREQCLAEYKKILENAVKNYNQMQKSAYKWKNITETEITKRFKLVLVSAIITPVLLLLNLIFK